MFNHINDPKPSQSGQTEATGIRVNTVAPVSFAKLKAQVQSGRYEWDVTAINRSEWLRAEREGPWRPVSRIASF